VTNLVQIAQYAIAGNVHWDNIAFWKKAETSKPGVLPPTKRGK